MTQDPFHKSYESIHTYIACGRLFPFKIITLWKSFAPSAWSEIGTKKDLRRRKPKDMPGGKGMQSWEFKNIRVKEGQIWMILSNHKNITSLRFEKRVISKQMSPRALWRTILSLWHERYIATTLWIFPTSMVVYWPVQFSVQNVGSSSTPLHCRREI